MKRATHKVENQVPELVDYNLYVHDVALQEALKREGGLGHEDELKTYGAWLGTAQSAVLAQQANVLAPVAEVFDPRGYRVDRVHFHPAWHELMRQAFAHGMHCSAWADNKPGRQVGRAAYYLLHGQIEAGTLCPLTMTSAAIALLKREPLYKDLQAQLTSLQYDASDQPLAGKKSMLIGMGMTEKQGGSDLRSNTTQAVPLGHTERGAEYLLTGHKWFCSAPTSDAHLMLAVDHEQYSCFYVPRWQADGRRNGVLIQKLKNKLGNRSNASAEIELDQARGVLVGEPGRGIATLVEMASYTRLDCVLGSTALMRQALVQSLHHARHRIAFGKRLIEQPLMRSVLADLALESEAATMLSLRLARAFEAQTDLDLAYRRMLVPAAKFWVCKRAVGLAAECMEVWGGNGYIEDGPMPRLLREAPVNAIWEGSGNIMCLDVLRGLQRKPELAQVLLDSLITESADEPLLSGRAEQLLALLSADEDSRQASARYVAQWLVLLVQANLLRRYAPVVVADAFLTSRFGEQGMALHGLYPYSAQAQALLSRAWQE